MERHLACASVSVFGEVGVQPCKHVVGLCTDRQPGLMQGDSCPCDVLQGSTRLILLARTLFARLQTRMHGVCATADAAVEQASVAEDCESEAFGSSPCMHVDASSNDDEEVVRDSSMGTDEQHTLDDNTCAGSQKVPAVSECSGVQTWLEWNYCMIRVASSVQMVIQSLAEMSGVHACRAGTISHLWHASFLHCTLSIETVTVFCEWHGRSSKCSGLSSTLSNALG